LIAPERLVAHFVAAVAVLAEHAGDRGIHACHDGVTVTAVGRGGAEFNTAWVSEQPSDADAAVGWARAQLAATGRPFMIQVPAPFREAVARCGPRACHWVASARGWCAN